MANRYFIGFDPGGIQSFGWVVMSEEKGSLAIVAKGTTSSAKGACESALAACCYPPTAVAIDAPLYWATEGDRAADQSVRKMVCDAGGSSGTVSHVNSLRGACLVQGVMAAIMVANLWPAALITEAHPKALLLVSAEAKLFSQRHEPAVESEHERDAALAAYAAFMFSKRSLGWQDLVQLEDEIHRPVASAVAYWFPEQTTNTNR
jgi:predicted nuclease with RNAse H fold